jgi:sugar phosphate isomerase/epimerase
MKVSLYTISYTGIWYAGPALQIEEIVPRIREMGYEGIEIAAKRPHASPLDWDKKKCEKVKELCNSYQMPIVALATYTNFASPIMEERENELLMLREQIKLASWLEASVVRVFAAWMGTALKDGHGTYDFSRHTWKYPGCTHQDRWNWVRSCLEEAVKWAEEYNLVLALQTHGPVVRLGYEDTLEMIKQVNSKYLKMSLDIGLACFDQFTQQSDEYIAKAVQECKDLIVHSHFNGKFEETPEGEVVQVPYDFPGLTPPGGSIINYPAFVRELKRINYQGYISYEVCSPVIKHGRLQGLEEVDRQVKLALRYMKNLIMKT